MRRVELVVTLLALAACRRESRRLEEPAYLSAAGLEVDAGAPLRAAPGPYDGNAWALGEGQRLYAQMNCVGCHSHGGGGMGPALMDADWIYGSDDATIFATIVSGRPNGMPAYRARLSDPQVWQLVAYVRSLSGLAPTQAAAVRTDHMSVRVGPARTPPAKKEDER